MAFLNQGQLLSYISYRFDPRNRVWKNMEDLELRVAHELDYWGFGTEPMGPLQYTTRDLPRRMRSELLEERAGIIGMQDIFHRMGEIRDFDELELGRRVADAFFERDNATIFRLWKTTEEAARTRSEPFGTFRIGREAFIGASADEISSRLAYIMPTIQIDPAESGPRAFRMAGQQLRGEFIRSTADYMADPHRLQGLTRMVLDVETPGLSPEMGVWQVHARLVRGDEIISQHTVHFDNRWMDVGAWGPDGLSFKKYYEGLRPGEKIQWERDFVRGITPVLEMAGEADILVGQNIPFDVGVLSRGIEGTPGISKELAEGFLDLAKHHAVDTRLMAAAILNDVIEIAPELKRLDRWTPYAIENILLQTDLLSGLDADNRTRIVRAIIDGGLHDPVLDVDVTDILFRRVTGVLAGQADLQAVPLSGDEFGLLRTRVAASGALTPFTKMSDKGVTPLQMSAMQARDPTFRALLGDDIFVGQLYERGVFSKWADDILGGSGRIGSLLGGNYEATFNAFIQDYAGVRERAMRAGLPFADLSPFERLASTLIGQHTNRFAPPGINAMRQEFGELTGSGLVRLTQEAKVHGGKNVALPMELLQEVDSTFGRALAEDGPQAVRTARWSLLKHDYSGTLHKDIALVADMDIDRLVTHIEGLTPERAAHFGLTEAVRKEVTQTLRKYGSKYGVQLGVMGGFGAASVDKIYNFLEQWGFGMDQGPHTLRTALAGVLKETGAEGERFLQTTGSWLDSPGAGARLQDVQATRALNEVISAAPKENPLHLAAIYASGGDPSRAGKIYRFTSRHIGKLRPRNLAIAAGIGAVTMFARRRQRQSLYDETMEAQEFEDPNFYDRYKMQMGEEVPRNLDPNSAAAIVQDLNRTRTRHHQMGNDKYDHLYAGV